MTRVIAINGSPRAEKGYTEKILVPFLEGMRQFAAETEVVYLKPLDIKPCAGEFICWEKRPGECHINDDMQELYPRIKRAEILVLATPVYIPLPGKMQDFINRLMPLLKPYISYKRGRTRAVFRSDVEIRNMVLVSSCGWWEKGNFATVVRIAKELASDASVEFAGALLRPHAGELTRNVQAAGLVTAAAFTAGREVIQKGMINRETLDAVAQPLIGAEEFRKDFNGITE